MLRQILRHIIRHIRNFVVTCLIMSMFVFALAVLMHYFGKPFTLFLLFGSIVTLGVLPIYGELVSNNRIEKLGRVLK